MSTPARQTSAFRTPAAHLRRAAVALVACAFALSCEAPAAALGDTTPRARTNAHDILHSFAERFGPYERDARYDSLRSKFASSALTPSRLFHDTSLWTDAEGDSRTLDLTGSSSPDDYAIGVAADPPEPAHVADYRRTTRLLHVGGDIYSWNARDELAIGSVTGDDLGRALTLLFTATEHTDGATARAALARDLPRTSAALGRLFSIDSLTIDPNALGGTDVRAVVSIHPDSLEHGFPHYAAYAHKYFAPTIYEMGLFDDAGREWWHVAKHDDRLSFAFRVHDGSLAPLSGPLSRIPNTLHLHAAASTKAFVFRVGFENLVGDVTLAHGPHARSATVRFTHDPNWQLPPLVEQMLRTPLTRPFAAPGAQLTYALLESPGGQSLAVRDYSITVEESKIMRWFGGLGHGAISDFRQGAEEEFDRFDREAMTALDTDVSALLVHAGQSPSAGR